MKHKHANVIKAFADGSECEVWYEARKKWGEVRCFNDFDLFETFRVKPEPKPDVVDYMYVVINRAIWSSKYEGNLKLIFDGENGKIKSAEVIK